MSEQLTAEKLSYQLKDINIIELNFKGAPASSEEKKSIGFTLQLEHRIAEDYSHVYVVVKVDTKTSNSDLACNIKVSVGFNVIGFEPKGPLENRFMPFPKEFVQALNIIAISTTRGVMFSEFKGTQLSGVVLPIIDINTLGDPKRIDSL